MTQIQKVLLELEIGCISHTYYVGGNAIYHVTTNNVVYSVRQHLKASHRFFHPVIMVGIQTYNPSSECEHIYVGITISDCAYNDLFLFRQQEHSWLLDSRPQNALNTHDICIQHLYMRRSARSEEDHRSRVKTSWCVHVYLHAGSPGIASQRGRS